MSIMPIAKSGGSTATEDTKYAKTGNKTICPARATSTGFGRLTIIVKSETHRVKPNWNINSVSIGNTIIILFIPNYIYASVLYCLKKNPNHHKDDWDFLSNAVLQCENFFCLSVMPQQEFPPPQVLPLERSPQLQELPQSQPPLLQEPQPLQTLELERSRQRRLQAPSPLPLCGSEQ